MEPQARKPVIGLVGGIGSGKSLVARQMATLGCGVIDSDQLARQVLEEPAVRAELVRWWGQAILGPEGRVDRRAVGRIVFDRPEERQRLEDLVHPRVHRARAALHEEYERDPKVRAVVEDMPLLLEKGFDRSCDAVVFVAASRATRLERVRTSRGWDEGELARREKAQVALDSKAARADYVVENDADEAQCYAGVTRVLSQIIQSTADAAGNPPMK
jgi:dephospho-CoA kinase